MEKQTISSFQFPPGVRFHPSDEELIVYYLINKVNSCPLPAAVIGEVELYNYNPWDLPKKAPFGDDECYFFSPRDRKYPNGARPNRTAASGYWKATGTDKPILSSSGARIGVKKALVFYIGKPPNGVKTDWIMIEYRIPDTLLRPQRSKGSMRLDDWVLCRIRQKGNMSKNAWDIPHSPSKLMGDLPNLKKQLPSVNTNKNTSDICSNYFLSQDCHLLVKLLATQAFPPISTVNRTTSQGSNSTTTKNCNGVYVQGSTKNSQVTDSYLDSSFNFQGKPNHENGYGDLSQSIKVIPHLNKNVDILLNNNNMLAANFNVTSTFFNQDDESQLVGDEFKHNLSNAIMNLQELDMSAFAENFL